jgi:hypothetical protein
MRALKELALVVHNNRLQSVELIQDYDGEGPMNKVQEFYYGLVRNELSEDELAAEVLLNTDRTDSRYQKLKSKLKRTLLNTVYFVDTRRSNYTDRQRAYYTVYKDWAAAKILLGKNARLVAIQLSQRLLNIAEKYEFTDLSVDVLRVLRLHFGAREGNLKKYESYNALFKYYESLFHYENRAEELYTELVLKFIKSKSSDEETRQKAIEYYAELEEPLARYTSYRLHLSALLIRLMIYSSVNDYKNTLTICDEALDFFQKKTYNASVPIQICYYQKLICYTQMKEYVQGKIAAEQCLSYLDEGSFNWFKYQELYFMLSMHTDNFQSAYQVYRQTTDHKSYQFLPPSLKEIWRIYESYLHFLVDMDRVEVAEHDTQFNKFRLGKFINETPIFSQDKRGMNIPILVIQIVFMIHQKKYGAAIDRIEAIQKYCSRYLVKDDTFRSNCFIKMLLQIPKASFHKAAVIRKSEKYLEKLENYPLNLSSQSHEIEIIPFEALWGLVLETLDNNFHKARKKS